MQRGACEALSLGKPVITSDWPILREYFSQGAVHVPNDWDSIRRGVEEVKDHYALYQVGIRDLQVSQRREWECKLAELTRQIERAMQGI
jgi:glycosyltransferase involved in cell wall biosynthesis